MSKPSLTAQELLFRECTAGTADGSRQLHEKYRPRLLWFARVMGIPWQDCHDIVQEVFVAAIPQVRSGEYRHESSLITWLDGILKHKIKDFWRSLDRSRRIFICFEPKNAADRRRIREYAVLSPRRLDEDLDV